MSAATATRTPATVRAFAGPEALVGTGALVRFNLRRDRVRLPAWLLALLVGTLSTADKFRTLYAAPRPAPPSSPHWTAPPDSP